MKRSCRAALLALLVFASAAQAQVAPSKPVFLIARPGMPDPNFRESVVLVVQSQGGETTGVILNRPTDRSLAELLPSERFEAFTDPIYFGGPVAQQGLFALFQADRYSGVAVPMLPQIYLAVLPDSVDALLDKPPAKIRFFSGYSGWAPGRWGTHMGYGMCGSSYIEKRRSVARQLPPSNVVICASELELRAATVVWPS